MREMYKGMTVKSTDGCTQNTHSDLVTNSWVHTAQPISLFEQLGDSASLETHNILTSDFTALPLGQG